MWGILVTTDKADPEKGEVRGEGQREGVWEQRAEPPGQSRCRQGWGVDELGRWGRVRGFKEPHNAPGFVLGILHVFHCLVLMAG